MAMVPIHNPYFKYTLVFPDGKKQTKGGSLTGWLSDMQWLEDTLLHGKPIKTTIENLVLTSRKGVPLKEQPEIIQQYSMAKETIKRRGGAKLRPHLQEALDEDPNAIHPGVEPWKPEPPNVEAFDDGEARSTVPVDNIKEPSGPQEPGVPK